MQEEDFTFKLEDDEKCGGEGYDRVQCQKQKVGDFVGRRRSKLEKAGNNKGGVPRVRREVRIRYKIRKPGFWSCFCH